MSADRKRCVVAYATRDEQWLWNVELPAEATVADALNEARALAKRDDVPWDSAPLGIFGQPCNRTDVPADGDHLMSATANTATVWERPFVSST